MLTAPKNHKLFLREFLDSFETTGAVLPTGPAACRALAAYVGKVEAPRRLLEVGAGTGVATIEIIRQMGPEDTLDIVELNDRFVAALQDRLKSDREWQSVAQRVEIHHLPIQEYQPAESYDAIVSGVPFNNFSVQMVEEILSKLRELAVPGATLSFIEYVAVRRFKSLASGRAERTRLSTIGRTLAEAKRNWGVGSELIFANVPPAWIHTLRFPQSA